MLNSFLAFHVNAVSNFAYMVTSNLWFLLLIIGVVGTIALNLKEEIDVSVREAVSYTHLDVYKRQL